MSRCRLYADTRESKHPFVTKTGKIDILDSDTVADGRVRGHELDVDAVVMGTRVMGWVGAVGNGVPVTTVRVHCRVVDTVIHHCPGSRHRDTPLYGQ